MIPIFLDIGQWWRYNRDQIFQSLISVADECLSTPCINGGTCVDGVNTFSCQCPTGYSGTFCEIRSNFCSSKSCGLDSSAQCIDVHSKDKPFCSCSSGFSHGKCYDRCTVTYEIKICRRTFLILKITIFKIIFATTPKIDATFSFLWFTFLENLLLNCLRKYWLIILSIEALSCECVKKSHWVKCTIETPWIRRPACFCDRCSLVLM